VSFVWPLVLLGLIAVPLLIGWYLAEQRRRTRATEAFVTVPLRPSVAPDGPRWRRHAPMLVFLVAAAALVVAAARPQRSVAVPITDGAVMLVDDVSSSMAATDVAPSRLQAAEHAAEVFLAHVPSSVRVGLLVFNQQPRLLQSPTSDRASVLDAFAGLRASGHTAVGNAIDAAVRELVRLRTPNGKRPPSAIVVLSDGTSTNGADPVTEARQAAASGIPVYTVAVGTPHGTIHVPRGSRTVTVPVPLSAGELAQIASAGKGRAFTAADAGGLSAVYANLAAKLGHKHIKREMTASVAGVGLVLLLVGSTLSLRWFGRLV
jgi:Ca-activated chloride channel family protein